MNDLSVLRPLEREYRSLYLETGFSTKDHAVELMEFQRFLDETAPGYRHLGMGTLGSHEQPLPDHAYFQEARDVSAIQHLRFLPAVYHSHQFFELACVLSGTVTHYIGQRKEELRQGDIFILAPQAKHAVCTYRDDTIMVNILVRSRLFESSFMNLLPDNYILRSFFASSLYGSTNMPYLLFSAGDDPQLRMFLEKLVYEAESELRFQDTMMRLLVSEMFVYLLREHEKDVIIPQIKSSTITENVLVILKYMQENYATISLRQMADFFNYSERQLSRIIKSATGVNFEDTIKQLRMNRAKELLRTSDLSVSDIAYSLGYCDTSSFRHAFKSYFQLTPKEFRELESS